MKNTILKYGAIAGLITTGMMIISTTMHNQNPDFKGSEIIGFAGMFIAFIFIFIGIKSFRDKQNNGVISFGTGFKIGFLISLIASTMYVITWMIECHFFFPDFMEKFAAHAIEEAQRSGQSAMEIEATKQEMNKYIEWYKNPFLLMALTYTEILPIGLIITLFSALILKKK
ncbi:MAG: DUF4199 domain-containing protein [Flavobacterium sp.]|nr:DUF4199 domain-containing protein [Flavobacterium sp.]